MTPEQLIKATILVQQGFVSFEEITAENLDDFCEDDEWQERLYDATYEFREGEVETGIPCDWSRHYESKSVAARMADGSWVGWTYWYGGGKHGEPEAIEWMPHAYFLDLTEEIKTVVVRTFSKAL